jgi:hypothetical protein
MLVVAADRVRVEGGSISDTDGRGGRGRADG